MPSSGPTWSAVASEHSTSPGRGKVDDPRRQVDVPADDVVAAPAWAAPVHADAHPQRERLDRLALEPLLELETRPQRVARVVEPEQQPVAELLHDATRRRKRGADERFLALEQRDRVLVAVRYRSAR